MPEVIKAVDALYMCVDSLPTENTGICRSLLYGQAPDDFSVESCHLRRATRGRRARVKHVGLEIQAKDAGHRSGAAQHEGNASRKREEELQTKIYISPGESWLTKQRAGQKRVSLSSFTIGTT